MKPSDTLDLAGRWRFALDPTDAGEGGRWFARPLSGSIQLPGSLPAAGIGDAVTVETRWTGSIFDRSYFTAPEYAPYRAPGATKVPFWLQPETHYVGAAWYQREIEIPAGWRGRALRLELERPHGATSAWLDDRPLGRATGLSAPHVHDLGDDVAPGRHVLTLRIDNRPDPDPGENSHSISDHTQGNWNGVVGRLALRATGRVWVQNLQVFPSWADRTVGVHGQLARAAAEPWPATLALTADSALATHHVIPVGPDGVFAATLYYPADAPAWDEFSPALHALRVVLPDGTARAVSFGFRRIAADGRRLTLNGRPLFLRGTLDCAAFPRTGHPPTDAGEWRRIFGAVQAHGLNHVRFHSWCPPAAAFAAADELGLYLQIEAAAWPNWSTTLGDGGALDAWLDEETRRILQAYGNHPSFVLFAACNEPGGPRATAWLDAWVRRHRAADPRRLYTAGSGWPETAANDFAVSFEPRIQHWGEGLASRINALPPETCTDYGDFVRSRAVPVIAHEIGQWCAFPRLAEMPKYTGYLRPRNFEIFRDTLAVHGLLERAAEWTENSGRLQALCYKEEIESALRTPDFGGFQLLGLQDFPGQGTAPVGVLDAFWEEKGYVAPADFRRFCGPTVLLARLERRVFTTADTLAATLEVSHFGAAPWPGTRVSWRLVADTGAIHAAGQLPPLNLALGAAQPCGRLAIALAGCCAPARLRLQAEIAGRGIANEWDVWVYPPARDVAVQAPPALHVTAELDDETVARLEAGAAVWWMIPPARVAPDPQRGPVALGFSGIFWNTAWTNRQPPHTLGVSCDPDHAAFAAFPTDAFSNWQWWYLVRAAAPLIIDGLPAALRPVVAVIDDWFTNRRLALAFEVRVGRGRLLVTSIDLGAAALDPVRRQLRASLLAYAAGPRFSPAAAATIDALRTLVKPAP